jgi:hypothetical protein
MHTVYIILAEHYLVLPLALSTPMHAQVLSAIVLPADLRRIVIADAGLILLLLAIIPSHQAIHAFQDNNAINAEWDMNGTL